MTLHDLAVEPLDVAADALGLLLDAPVPAALAELTLREGDGSGDTDALVLGVLSASHVVTASRAGHRMTEQVSCEAVAAGGSPLPERWEAGGYRLRTTTRRLPAPELTALADELRERADADDWVCGTFPGADAALTALTGRAVPGGWSWRTWHLYPGPQAGVVVETESTWQP